MKVPPALNPLRNTTFKWVIPFAWATMTFVARTAPITIEVFLHHGFGARSGIPLLKGFALIGVVCFLSTQGVQSTRSSFFPGYILAFAVISISHWLQRGSEQGRNPVHSCWTGDPWPAWRHIPLSTLAIKGYVEPTLAFLIGLVIQPFDLSLGCWLEFAAICLFVQEQCFRHRVRTRQLDSIDGRVEANMFAPPPPTEENDGFVEARPAPPPNDRR